MTPAPARVPRRSPSRSPSSVTWILTARSRPPVRALRNPSRVVPKTKSSSVRFWTGAGGGVAAAPGSASASVGAPPSAQLRHDPRLVGEELARGKGGLEICGLDLHVVGLRLHLPPLGLVLGDARDGGLEEARLVRIARDEGAFDPVLSLELELLHPSGDEVVEELVLGELLRVPQSAAAERHEDNDDHREEQEEGSEGARFAPLVARVLRFSHGVVIDPEPRNLQWSSTVAAGESGGGSWRPPQNPSLRRIRSAHSPRMGILASPPCVMVPGGNHRCVRPSCPALVPITCAGSAFRRRRAERPRGAALPRA